MVINTFSLPKRKYPLPVGTEIPLTKRPILNLNFSFSICLLTSISQTIYWFSFTAIIYLPLGEKSINSGSKPSSISNVPLEFWPYINDNDNNVKQRIAVFFILINIVLGIYRL